MVNIFLLLGSNMGDRSHYLSQAIDHINTEVGVVQRASAIYETQAWGKTDEADYLNQVLLVRTGLSARSILEKVLHIEEELGRRRREKWGARTIDIDILFYGNDIINEPGLIIPHPELHNRRFTLAPMAELAPELIHPVLQLDMVQLKNNLQDQFIVKKL